MIRIEKLIHKYTVWKNETQKAKKTVLDGISLEIPSGQFLAILGPNGCGKSTLAKHLNGLLLPAEGTVWIDGKKTSEEAVMDQIREQVGMVFQNPDNQIVGTSVEEDVAFGPENRCVPSADIQERVAQGLKAVGLLAKRRVSPNRLSGGQKQRVAIAGTIVDEAKCLVLDEPTAMLDPNARREVLALVRYLNKEKGITVVLITHHTDEVVDADSILLMDHGQVVGQGTPKEIFSDLTLLKKVKMDTPQVTELADQLFREGLPLSLPVLHEEELVEQLVPLLQSRAVVDTAATAQDCDAEQPAAGEPILSAKGLSFTYGQKTVDECHVLKNVSLDIFAGQCVGIIGASGSGKTTLIKHLNGLLCATGGDVRFLGQSIYQKGFNLTGLRKEVGLVFQYPEHQLFCSTVLKDVCYGPINLGASPQKAEEMAKRSLSMVDIGQEYYYANPLDLSGGEKRRVAIAGVLAMEPKVLILDEPAAGLDPETKHMVFRLLTKIKQELGIAIVLVSHHMEDVAEYADHVVVLHRGEIAVEGSPHTVFHQTAELKEMGIGIPQVTSVTKRLIEEGVGLAAPAVTVEQARQQLLDLWKKEVPAL